VDWVPVPALIATLTLFFGLAAPATQPSALAAAIAPAPSAAAAKEAKNSGHVGAVPEVGPGLTFATLRVVVRPLQL
jgi:hypothetical protein